CFVFNPDLSPPLPETVVRAAPILPAHVDCAARNNFRRDLFRDRLVAIEGGSRHLRSEQARTDGISQRDSGSERKNFRPDLRREPRDNPLRSIATRSGSAVVAMEDNKFYQHSGYDLFGIVRAALVNFVSGHVRQGASTITQQLARNSFALKERTYRRKLLEIYVAERIEQHFGKQKIMELYLNRIYFGGGLYGAEAAARGYFDKPAREMSLVECATLAGVIKSPNRLSPWSDRGAARESRNVALSRMRDLRFIDRQRCAAAQSEDILIGNRQSAQGQTYAVDYIRQKVIEAVGWNRAMNEGFRIQ